MGKTDVFDIEHVFIWDYSNRFCLTVVAYLKDYSADCLKVFGCYISYNMRRDDGCREYVRIRFEKGFDEYEALETTSGFPPEEYCDDDSEEPVLINEYEQSQYVRLHDYIEQLRIPLSGNATAGSTVTAGVMIDHCLDGCEVDEDLTERGGVRFGSHAVSMSQGIDPLFVLLISKKFGRECVLSPLAIQCTFEGNLSWRDFDSNKKLLRYIKRSETIPLVDLELLEAHDPRSQAFVVPKEPGIFIWRERASGKPVYIGAATVKGGLKDQIVDRDLKEGFLVTGRLNLAKVKGKIRPGWDFGGAVDGQVAAEKSKFRRIVCEAYPVWPGKSCVDFIKDNFTVSWVALPDISKEDISEYERKLLEAYCPRFNCM